MWLFTALRYLCCHCSDYHLTETMVARTFVWIHIVCCILLVLLVPPTESLLFGQPATTTRTTTSHRRNVLFTTPDNSNDNNDSTELTVSQAIQSRYACKAFQRFDGADAAETASPPDPTVVQTAWKCLDLARLSPSAFNTQPYRVVLVHSAAQKLALSRACLGPNARRVLDADCTAVFLADKQVLKTMPARDESKQGPPKGRTTLFYIALFSSGYPLPRILSATISFLMRTAMSWIDVVTRKFLHYPLPTLSSAETWATKQTSLVAMSYMLACASQSLATIPMEGINAAGIRRVLGIPRRYAIPLIVATGRPASPSRPASLARRYPTQNVIFADRWKEPLSLEGVQQ